MPDASVTHAPACPICAEAAIPLRRGFKGFREPDRYDIFLCDRCDLQFAWPFQASNEIYQAIYTKPSRYSGYDRYQRYKADVAAAKTPLDALRCKEAMYWFIADEISRRDPTKSKKILEVGCGLGYLTYALKQAGYNVMGLDISRPAIEQAKAQFGENYICADVINLPSNMTETFDIIIMTEVLEHLESPNLVLSSLWNLLAPGGCALITTPSKNFLPPNAIWRTDSPPVHLAWYSETSLREMARQTGFRLQFADFTDFNAGMVAGLGARRDLASGDGAFRMSVEGNPLDKIKPQTKINAWIDTHAPSLRRLLRRKKFTQRAVELYSTQSEVLGAIFERPASAPVRRDSV